MRTMFDAVTATNIPITATLVAGYDDVIKLADWSPADWARFPHARLVRITKKATTNDGHVGDCETGDMTPAELVGWIVLRRLHGADPTGYCSMSRWAECIREFTSRRVPVPHWWIAEYDGKAELPSITVDGVTYTAVAKQYADPGPYDRSIVADYWPGVDPAPQEVPDMLLTDKLDTNPAPGTVNEALNSVLFGIAGVRSAGQLAVAVYNLGNQVNVLATTVATMATAQTGVQVTKDEVLAAIRDATTAVETGQGATISIPPASPVSASSTPA